MLSSLTGVRNVIVFTFDTYKSLYLCIFQFVIRAGLAGRHYPHRPIALATLPSLTLSS